MRGPRLFLSRLALANEKGRDDRVDLVVAADVLDVGVELVAQADIERQIGPEAPVVLHEHRHVVVVRAVDDKRLIGLSAAQRDREQQIAIVDAAVAVVVESGEVLDEFDAPLAEHAEVETAMDLLPLAAAADRVCGRVPSSPYPRAGSGAASFPAARGTSCPSWMLGNVNCGVTTTGSMVLRKRAEGRGGGIDERRRHRSASTIATAD